MFEACIIGYFIIENSLLPMCNKIASNKQETTLIWYICCYFYSTIIIYMLNLSHNNIQNNMSLNIMTIKLFREISAPYNQKLLWLKLRLKIKKFKVYEYIVSYLVHFIFKFLASAKKMLVWYMVYCFNWNLK